MQVKAGRDITHGQAYSTLGKLQALKIVQIDRLEGQCDDA
jgi:hypothetical protein